MFFQKFRYDQFDWQSVGKARLHMANPLLKVDSTQSTQRVYGAVS